MRRDPFPRKVEATIKSQRMLRGRDSVLVAVSGGPDSVALLAAMVELGRGRWRVAAGHVNHRLRGKASDADQRFVERLGRRLGVEVRLAEGALRGRANLEERARDLRYRRLGEMARAGGYRRVATGHTRDDQAETVLHRQLRGAGARGLRGIAPVREDGVVRPLLALSRAQVLAFLARSGLRFRSDRSNQSLRFTRNRIRRRLLPLLEREFNPAIRGALARTAEILREDEVWLDALARRRLRQLARGRLLDARRLARIPVALARRVVRRWLADLRGDLRRVGLEHVDQVRALGNRGRGGISIPGGTVVANDGKLHWEPRYRPAAKAAVEFSFELPEVGDLICGLWRIHICRQKRTSALRPGPWRAAFDAEVLGRRSLGLRAPRPGDRVRPLGLGGTKKLQDVFVDAKVSRAERSAWPVVHQAGEILWLPGLVRAESAPVTRRTRWLVVLEASRRGRKA